MYDILLNRYCQMYLYKSYPQLELGKWLDTLSWKVKVPFKLYNSRKAASWINLLEFLWNVDNIICAILRCQRDTLWGPIVAGGFRGRRYHLRSDAQRCLWVFATKQLWTAIQGIWNVSGDNPWKRATPGWEQEKSLDMERGCKQYGDAVSFPLS